MGHKTVLWQLSRSEPLGCLFTDQHDLDEWMSACVESYTMCRQREYGDVHSRNGLELSFQKVHAHIYSDQGGCRWCRNRVNLKMQEALQQRLGKGGSDQKGLNTLSPVISLS